MKVHTLYAASLLLAIAGCSTSQDTEADGSGGSGSGGSGGSDTSVGGGSGGDSEIDKCAGDIYDGELIPLDMMILMDRSGSMDDVVAAGSSTSRWKATTGALRDFVKADMGGEVSVGVQFFPLDYEGPMPVPLMGQGCALSSDDCGPYSNCQDNTFFTMCSPITNMPNMSCEPKDYKTAAVPITKLPDGVDAVEGALATTLPDGGTPMTPAMQGAMGYLMDHATANPDRLHVMVLASDGDPSGCGETNDAEGVGEIAKRGMENTPEIKTFVIGVGVDSQLDLIAYQGGTDEATLVTGDDTGEKFLERLNEIRNALVDCRYTIPVPESGTPNFEEVNFKYDGDIVGWVASEADCGTDAGWYYDNPDDPTLIHMCPASCALIEEQGGTVEIEIGCVTEPR